MIVYYVYLLSVVKSSPKCNSIPQKLIPEEIMIINGSAFQPGLKVQKMYLGGIFLSKQSS